MSSNTTKPLSELNIAWGGGLYFANTFREHVKELRRFPIAGKPRDWDYIVEKCGFVPDVLVFADQSRPPMLLGIESYPCLTIFLSVDSHIHSWYPLYAQAFDLCTVSLKDHIPNYTEGRSSADEVLWLPPFCRTQDKPHDEKKEWDLLFVGNVGKDIFPKRTQLLQELSEKLPGLHVTTGAYRDLYPKAHLILNIAERGDMNYRLFEVLACGGCLVTPKIGHGQEELFTDGEDLFTYDQDDVDGLVTLVENLLADPARCEAVARSGHEKVNAKHREWRRGEEFAQWIDSFDHQALIEKRLTHKKALFNSTLKLIYLHFAESLDDDELRQTYLRASQKRLG